MSDFAIAGALLAFLVGLAVTAPIWGVDSRDGIESDESARRVAWLHGGRGGVSSSVSDRGFGARTAGVSLAGALRMVARRLDADAAESAECGCQVAPAC